MADENLEDKLANAGRNDRKTDVPEKRLERARGKSLEERLNPAKENKGKKFSLREIVNTGFIGLTSLLSYASVGASAIIGGAGYGLGYILEKKKEKTPVKLYDLIKEVGTGFFIGFLGHKLYSYINHLIPNKTLPGKILKTLIWNPVMYAGFNGFFRALRYLRDDVGLWNLVKGVFNGKIFGYIRDTGRTVKEDWPQAMSRTKWFMPFNYYALNYLNNPTAQVAFATMLDTAYRFFVGGKDIGQKKINNQEKQRMQAPQYGLPPQGYAPAPGY